MQYGMLVGEKSELPYGLLKMAPSGSWQPGFSYKVEFKDFRSFGCTFPFHRNTAEIGAVPF